MCDFTLEHYKEILKSAKRKGFQFVFFTETKLPKKAIFLRHDVDVSLENAILMAEIEKQHNVCSTFFIRTHSNFYNSISPDSVKKIKKILSFGHQIGIHYDGAITNNLEELINKQFDYLKQCFKISRVISFHRPGFKIFGLELKNFINTYNSYFFKECEYLSDSNRELKRGCIKEFIEKTNSNRIQILIHPFWWNEKNLNLKQLYRNLLKIKEREIVEELKSDIKDYKIFFEKYERYYSFNYRCRSTWRTRYN